MVENSTRLVIDKERLYDNVEYIKKSKKKALLPVVKANAYGHGMEEIVNLLYAIGQREFAVARYVEAERIRKMNLKGVRILVFESIGDFSLVENKSDIDISANTFEELRKALDYGISPSRIQLKIDFGFGRNGIFVSEVEDIKRLMEDKNLKFRGIYSHLFAVDYEDGLKYIGEFDKVLEILGKENFEMIHLQNTAATLTYDCPSVSHVRVGMAIYGLQDDGYCENNLKQIFVLETQVAGVRDLEGNKYIAYDLKQGGYGENAKYIGKIKIGYADGFLKSNEGSTCLIGNKEYKIVQVTMDNTFIEVDSRIKEGDKVLLYHNITKVTAHNNMTIYQLLTILSPRVERVVK